MKISGINGFRGFIALIIVLYHLNQFRPTFNLSEIDWHVYQFIEMLPVVVAVFFILSGFLCSLKYWQYIFQGREEPNFKKVILDRFYRIAPLYYLAIFSSFVCAYVLNFATDNAFIKILAGLSFTSWVHPVTFFPSENNGPLWFVSYDMMGYILTAFVMSILIKIRMRFIPMMYIFVITILLGLHFLFISLPFPHIEGIISVWFPYYNPFIFGIYFICGSIICGIFTKYQDSLKNKQIWFDIGSIIILSVISLVLWKWKGSRDLDYSYPMSPYRFPFIMILWSIFLFFLMVSRYVSWLFDNRIFLFLGTISYPLYLFHALVIQGVRQYFFQINIFGSWLLFAVLSCIFSIISAYILSRYCEKYLKTGLQKILKIFHLKK